MKKLTDEELEEFENVFETLERYKASNFIEETQQSNIDKILSLIAEVKEYRAEDKRADCVYKGGGTDPD